MASTSRRSKKHDGLLSKLDLAIKLLSGAKDVCGVAPAQIALGAACVLLAAIRVRLVLSFFDEPPVDFYSGYHGERTGLRRSRTPLR